MHMKDRVQLWATPAPISQGKVWRWIMSGPFTLVNLECPAFGPKPMEAKHLERLEALTMHR